MEKINFEVKITSTVEKRLQKMDENMHEGFASQIEKLERFPKKYGKPLKGRLHGYWQLRLEDKYRIWYTVDEEEETVTVEAIKHKDDAKEHY